jgi:excisionase family DNA binding protein
MLNLRTTTTTPRADSWISVREMSRRFAISPAKIYKLLKSGSLDSVLLAGTMRRISVSSVERLLASAPSTPRHVPMVAANEAKAGASAETVDETRAKADETFDEKMTARGLLTADGRAPAWRWSRWLSSAPSSPSRFGGYAVMGKRSSFLRRVADDYATPVAAVWPLLPHVTPRSSFIEPCVGAGKLAKHLQEAGLVLAHAFGIEYDATCMKYPADGEVFITNPPWTRELLHPSVHDRRPPRGIVLDME